MNHRYFFFFSSNEFFCLGSYSVQDKLFRELEKRERDAVWETLVFSVCVCVCVHVCDAYTFASMEQLLGVPDRQPGAVRPFVMWM